MSGVEWSARSANNSEFPNSCLRFALPFDVARSFPANYPEFPDCPYRKPHVRQNSSVHGTNGPDTECSFPREPGSNPRLWLAMKYPVAWSQRGPVAGAPGTNVCEDNFAS
jgi:hypothetical protein